MKPGNNRGSKNFKSKLTESEVLDIFSSEYPQSKLAERFGVSQTCVNHIKTGRTWRWLTHKERKEPGCTTT